MANTPNHAPSGINQPILAGQMHDTPDTKQLEQVNHISHTLDTMSLDRTKKKQKRKQKKKTQKKKKQKKNVERDDVALRQLLVAMRGSPSCWACNFPLRILPPRNCSRCGMPN
jgi:hypothetical protein